MDGRSEMGLATRPAWWDPLLSWAKATDTHSHAVDVRLANLASPQVVQGSLSVAGPGARGDA